MDFEKIFRRERFLIWLRAAMWVLAGAYLVTGALIAGKVRALVLVYEFSLFAALVAGAFFLGRARAKKAAAYAEPPEERWRALYDRYTRRSANWLLICFLRVFTMAIGLVGLAVNSRANEMSEAFSVYQASMEIAAFFLVKNLLVVRWLHGRHPFDKMPLFRAECRRLSIVSAVYCAVAGALYYGFESVFVLNITAFVTLLFAAWIVLYNFFLPVRFTYTGKRRPWVVAGVAAAIALVIGGYAFLSRAVWLTQPYINQTPYIYEGESKISYDEATGVYTVTKPDGDFRILQVTDVHIGGGALSYGKDLKALKAVFALLEATKPDLVIVTGDLCYPVGLSSFSFNNTAPVSQFAAFMRNTGVPWAFSYGNHDTENMAASTKSDLDETFRSLSWKTSRTLLYPYVQPEVTGRNNQLIEIRNADGGLREALFLIDSNAYTGGFSKYDCIRDDQVDWYREQVLRLTAEEGRTVPSMGFFHIPLQEYRTAFELYKAGSGEVTYYFGENTEGGTGKVCCSDFPSMLFDTAAELGSTTGFFCGHDHYNNISLGYRGIRLTYGMSIDYLVEPGIARDTKQRGATLITLRDDGTEDIVQVPLDSLPEA